MPVRSKAQLAKFGALKAQGKISDAMFHEWTQGVDTSKLPERVGEKRGGVTLTRVRKGKR